MRCSGSSRTIDAGIASSTACKNEASPNGTVAAEATKGELISVLSPMARITLYHSATAPEIRGNSQRLMPNFGDGRQARQRHRWSARGADRGRTLVRERAAA